MRRMLLGQSGVDRPGHHPPGLMPKLFDLCEGTNLSK